MLSWYEDKNYARSRSEYPLPSLINIQLNSFNWFLQEGLIELFNEISPIESFNGNLKLYFPGEKATAQGFNLNFWFEDPKYDVDLSLERDIDFARPLYVRVALVNNDTGEIQESDIFLGNFPVMTESGTFIINGTERVVVSQLIRSPGVYFGATEDRTTGRKMSNAKMIPDRGAWMEFETRKSDYITLKFNRKRTVPVTILLRALAAVTDEMDDISPIKEGTDEELYELFKDIDTDPNRPYLANTIDAEPQWDDRDGKYNISEMALLEFYKRMRPGDPPTLENAREYLESQLFDRRRYDLERVGRYKLNQRLRMDKVIPRTHRNITKYDLVQLVRRMIEINNELEKPDDVDHLGNRRVKTVGELIQNKLRIGLRRMERVVKERMSIRESEGLTPTSLINIRPIVAAVREFFGSSQLSQFMEQTNPLAELTHKRTVSALGPGGLRRERAGFEVRDVHHSHYGRICPIETPEGPNIGLIGRLATFGFVNDYGFIETPYRRVYHDLPIDSDKLIGRTLSEDVEVDDKVIAEEDAIIDDKMVKALKKAGIENVSVRPFVSDESEYLSADAEDRYRISQANAKVDDLGQFVTDRVSARYQQKFLMEHISRIDYMDVAPRQIVGISASLIPFLEHDDANRALMGSNMQRQAVPLLKPDVPVVSTGMEDHAAYDSGQIVIAQADGDVISVQGDRIIIREEDGNERTYILRKYNRSNQSTCIDQKPVVQKGQRVARGDVIGDSSSTQHGHIALGHNVLCAFLSWEGGNFEDALLINEEMVRYDRFTSIHIEKHEVEARDTKLGPEEITYDIPNVGDAVKDLDEFGIIRIGAEVKPKDILVGKITPKGERELSPEEKLLRAIFGEKAREVRDTSLRLPHGERGKVIDVKVFTRDEHRDLPAGVEQMVRVTVAQKRKLNPGDKMAGRHGNKGVISMIVPIEDMPYLEDGRPVDIILNPLGVPGRMNVGQILETHLGWAADRLGFRAVTPVFDGAKEYEIQAELGRAWMIDYAWDQIMERAWTWMRENEYDTEQFWNDDEVRRAYIDAWIGDDPVYDRERLALDQTYARRSVLREYLIEKGYNPDADILAFYIQDMEVEERQHRDDHAVRACLRLWIESVTGEEVPDMSQDDLEDLTKRLQMQHKQYAPIYGKMKLFDGKTGQAFEQSVTVGIIHMLKLAHLVEDKVHARSTGPYSLVTQQPLGGKAQFGGQRFGEMEVWALEAYGAAYTLQEMLTVKSDDVQGRVNTYESIVKGEPIDEPGIPASFRVLVKELQSLGLAVEAITETGEIISFGREDKKNKEKEIPTGLFGIGNNRPSLN